MNLDDYRKLYRSKCEGYDDTLADDDGLMAVVNAALEEAAKECEQYDGGDFEMEVTASRFAEVIRTLKRPDAADSVAKEK